MCVESSKTDSLYNIRFKIKANAHCIHTYQQNYYLTGYDD